jgi:hypothetical protein
MSYAEWERMDREDKVRAIFKYTREGLLPRQMAERWGIEAQHIYALAREEGFAVISQYSTWPTKDEPPIGYNSNSLWGAHPDELRASIWKRAKQAAKERLRALEAEQLDAAEIEHIKSRFKVVPANRNNAVESVETYSNDPFLKALRQQIG